MSEIFSSEDKARLIKGFSSASCKPVVRRFICILYGNSGSGKSSTCATARRPILWHSFDPGGAESEKVWPHVALKPEDLGGEKYILLNNAFEFDSPTNPSAMKNWAMEFQRLKENRLFDFFATWVIDSLTLFSDANMSQHLSIIGRDIPYMEKGWGKTNDYADAANKFKRVMKEVLSVPIDIVMTGHPDVTTDTLNENKKKSSLLLPGALKETLPIYVSEYYISEVTNTPKGSDYRLRTRTDGVYAAKSRKASLLNEYEEPNLLSIMKKAGYNYEHKSY